MVLTIARMHAESVAYYESTVDQVQAQNSGPDAYYSEDGTRPAEAWIVARTDQKQAAVSEFLGTEPGAVLGGETVQKWFNRALAPSGHKLGRRPGERGVPGFDLTFCAPKSVSLVWGLSESEVIREAVDRAHAQAVSHALAYLSEHAGYTRRASDHDPAEMIIDRVEALSGAKYEHRTSRAGDPHVHSHVLVSNRQLCADGKARALDGTSLFHEARGASMIYQSVLRAKLSESLGVQWSEVTNGCAEIAGLDDRELLAEYSTRMREIDLWRAENGLDSDAGARMGQKITRRVKDTDTSLEELRGRWNESESAGKIRAGIAGFGSNSASEAERSEAPLVPVAGEVVNAVIAERSTFTRADLVEKAAEMMPVGAVDPEKIHATVESIVDEVVETGTAWSVNPDAARSFTKTAREGSQRFTAEPVVEEINRGIDVATARADRGVDASSIQSIEGQLSENQAAAMRQVVASRYRASVVVAPAGAGKTSSLKAARKAWEQAGKTVVGLAPTGKASDVMVREEVAHSSATIARVFIGTDDLEPAQIAARLGWNQDTVVVVDEAGMVATPDVVTLLDVATAADARVVFVGDPHQYSAVKARSGMLATLARELPDAVELDEVFRQKDAGERIASQWLRNGDEVDTKRAAQWYAKKGRVHAGSTSAMLMDALDGWAADGEAGRNSLLVAATCEDVDLLNEVAQKSLIDSGDLQATGPVARLSGTQQAYVGDVVLTRRNDYQLTTDADDVVRNGQRWAVENVHQDGSVTARRQDESNATVTLPGSYVREHVQLGYASTGHAAQGATVDVCRVVAGVGQVDRAGVYVPMTRGREENHLYLMEKQAGDPDTAHFHLLADERRESAEYARDLLVQAAGKDRADVSPHQVWDAARRDFELARLSSNQRTDVSPFAGTRMAEVMVERHERRRQRFQDYYRTTYGKKKQAPAQRKTPEQMVEESLPTRPLHWVNDLDLRIMANTPNYVPIIRIKARDHHEKLCESAAQAHQATEKIADLSSQLSELDTGVEVATQHAEQARQAHDRAKATRDNRSMLGRWTRGGRDQAAVDQARQDEHIVRERLNKVHAARSKVAGQMAELERVASVRPAPKAEEIEKAQQQVGKLDQLVDALDQQDVVAHEMEWRTKAGTMLREADTRHRQELGDESVIEAFDPFAELYQHSIQDTVRTAKTRTSRQAGLENQAYIQPSPQLGNDSGLDL